MTQEAIAPTRQRTRTINTAQSNTNSSPEMVALLREYAILNHHSNAYKRDMDAKKKELNIAMVRAGISDVSTAVTLPDGSVSMFEAAIGSQPEEVVDVALLRKLVSDDVFMSIISATKTAVKEKAGTNVLIVSTVEQEGREGLSIKKMR